MIYSIKPTSKYKADLKLAKKQGFDMSKIEFVLDELSLGHKLDKSYDPHPVHGEYEGCMSCHVTPNMILIYRYEESNLILHAIRFGTHNRIYVKF